VEDTSKIMVALTKDFFVELSQEEALNYIDKKEKYLNEKSAALTKRASEIKAHILFVKEAIRELLNISEEKTPK
jgi:prefoldin subunit 5